MRPALMLATLAVALFGLAAIWSPPIASADDQSVDMGNLWYCNASFEDGVCTTSITAGDTVTWVNVAGFHTVTECAANHDPCPAPGGFESGQMEVSDTFSHTFADAGSYEYYCSFHPSQMQGIVLVQEAPTPTPVPTAPPPGETLAPTVAVASVPKTGGPPAAEPASLAWMLALGAGIALLGTSGALAFASIRRRDE